VVKLLKRERRSPLKEGRKGRGYEHDRSRCVRMFNSLVTATQISLFQPPLPHLGA